MFALGLQTALKIDQTYSRFHQCQHLLMRGIVDLTRRFAKCLGKPGNHLRVDRIVLGQAPCRQREAADPLGVHIRVSMPASRSILTQPRS